MGLPRSQIRVGQVAAVALPSAGTAVAFVVLSRFHVVGDKPVWVILVTLLLAALIGESTGRLLQAKQTIWAAHVMVGLQCLSVAAILYLIGWGPALAIGFLFVGARALDIVGSRVWYVVVIWAAVGTAAGQIAIALHLVSSYLPVPWVHGLAALEVLGVGFVIWVLGEKTRQSELALAERDLAARDARSTLSLLTATLDSTADGILVVGNEGSITQFNSRFAEMWRIPERVLASRMTSLRFSLSSNNSSPLRRSSPRFRSSTPILRWRAMTSSISRTGGSSNATRCLRRSKEWSSEECGASVMSQIITSSSPSSNTKPSTTVSPDWQTGHFFRNRLDNALRRSQRTGITVAVLFCDLDGFKIVNDTLGHDVGDLLLVEVGGRFDACLRDGDTVARLGGDEFAIILDGTSPQGAVQTASRILKSLREPFQINGREIDIRASVGVADSTGEGAEADALLCQADIAMYAAKASGRDRVVSFEPRMQTTIAARHALHGDLRQAMRDK